MSAGRAASGGLPVVMRDGGCYLRDTYLGGAHVE